MLQLVPYLSQAATLPTEGRHILAQFDDDTLVVYQAYKPSIAEWAVAHGRLGGPEFGLGRMSWVKPNFLWMMYRCGWATKQDQERVLALRIDRRFFDELLALAVPSSRDRRRFDSEAAWREAVKRSDVRLQWDPDHDPSGAPLPRRAIQLGLRGEVLRRLCEEELREVHDVTAMVTSERVHVAAGRLDALSVPREAVYRPGEEIAAALGLDAANG